MNPCKPHLSLRSRRAAASRNELRQLMGGVCQMCPATQPLEFDCYPVPETSHHFMPWPQRIRFYWQQHLKGNLRLLCRKCHLRQTAIHNSKGSKLTWELTSRPISNFDAQRDWSCQL
jgi:hypothetical protein